jgi:chloride channel 7
MNLLAPDNARHEGRSARGVSVDAGSRFAAALQQVAVLATGALVAALVAALRLAIRRLAWAREACFSSAYVTSAPLLHGWLASVGWGLALASVAYAAVGCVPQAQGSGLPPLIVYLNGTKVLRYSSVRVLAAKFVGTACCVASGLFCGPEGPIIHMGAAVGKQVLRRLCRLHRLLDAALPAEGGRCGGGRVVRHVREALREMAAMVNDLDQRDFAAIGAGAGVSAAFHAPLSATLFVVEEASSHFSLPLLWRAFTGAVAALFVTHVLAIVRGDESDLTAAYLHIGTTDPFCTPRWWELGLVALLGLLGGGLGAAFNQYVLGVRRLMSR